MSAAGGRYTYRDVPYRPPLDERGEEAGRRVLYTRFFGRYIWPHRRLVALCILLASLNANSVYLVAYYARIVVDDILVVSPVAEAARAVGGREESVTARDHRPPAAGLPRVGGASEAARAAGASSRPPGAMGKLMGLFGVYLATILVLNAGARVGRRLRIGIALAMTVQLREDMHRKIMSLSVSYHRSHSPGRLMARILSDVTVMRRMMLNTIVDAASHLVMLVTGVVLLCILEWRVALFSLCVMVPYCLVVRRARRGIKELSREVRHTNGCLWGLATQKLDGVRAVVAYGRERLEQLGFHRLLSCFLRDSLRRERASGMVAAMGLVVTGVTTVAVLLWCTRLVLAGQMTVGKMMFVYAAVANLFMPLLGLTRMSVVVTRLLVILNRLVQVIDEPEEIEETPGAVEFPARLHSGITLRGVTFSYGPESEPVLRDIDLPVRAGQWVCVMGPSGSGKSTLLALLARLYDPSSGEVLVDGIPLSRFKLASLHRRVVLVSQEAQIFSGTARDNLTYGRPEALPSEIMAAAKAADCHEFIMELPVKYETTLGEKGITLSGGQRQRVSVARALLTEPEVLLLDDITSALDAKTERRVQERLSRLMKGKTAVIVSHRVSMAMRCDRVCVLEGGRIAEAGTHDELLARGGFYSRLHAEQTG